MGEERTVARADGEGTTGTTGSTGGGRRTARRVVAAAVAALVALAGGTVAATSAEAAVPKSFTLTGSGFGHGVGMPQYGAYQMSRQGTLGRNILKYYYPGATVSWKTTPKDVLVQVFGPDPGGSTAYGDRKTSTTVTITGGDWRLRSAAGTTLASGTGTTTLKVATTTGSRTRVTVGGKTYDGALLRIHWSGTRYYKSTGKKAVATVAGTHGSYRNGRLTATVQQGYTNLTNDVLLNTEYLYGIAEMPSSWGLNGGFDALSAQAITARSYAMSKPSLRSGCLCNVVDDVRDQYYSGWNKENEGTGAKYGKVWTSAVRASVRGATEARVLTYGGLPVAAHYYSSSGGRTANSEDVWSSVIPYERSVADPYSKAAPGNSYASWTRTLTQAQARTLFGLADVQSIRVSAKWSSGQLRTLVATSSTGKTATVTGKADAMRAKVGARTTTGSMPAAWISKITAVS
ncbi:SpoIID/LytB domain-containing protein [Isoptericola sp. NPDC057653]|uniref:SpoIID/LytB domain-containing protein n=1 Tax=unclassified Isoptericola TaxID=2623355 RepID=UPI0036842918